MTKPDKPKIAGRYQAAVCETSAGHSVNLFRCDDGPLVHYADYERMREWAEYLASRCGEGPDQALRDMAGFVHDTFKRDLDEGFLTRDKEFAVVVLGKALSR